MNIRTEKNAQTLTLLLSGRLDTVTAPELEETIKGSLDDTEKLVFDLSELEYISSAGLRVLLASQKKMNQLGGTMSVKNVCDAVREVFEVTGLDNVLAFE